MSVQEHQTVWKLRSKIDAVTGGRRFMRCRCGPETLRQGGASPTWWSLVCEKLDWPDKYIRNRNNHRFWRSSGNDVITTDMHRFALRTESKPVRFYLLRKVHEAGVPRGPAISRCQPQAEGISELVNHFIYPLVPTIPSYIKETNDFLSLVSLMYPLVRSPATRSFTGHHWRHRTLPVYTRISCAIQNSRQHALSGQNRTSDLPLR